MLPFFSFGRDSEGPPAVARPICQSLLSVPGLQLWGLLTFRERFSQRHVSGRWGHLPPRQPRTWSLHLPGAIFSGLGQARQGQVDGARLHLGSSSCCFASCYPNCLRLWAADLGVDPEAKGSQKAENREPKSQNLNAKKPKEKKEKRKPGNISSTCFVRDSNTVCQDSN